MGRVEFTGARFELFLIVIRGYALMLPTLGLYRFWQATWKRRFYWQNTVIDGEPLEYTGTPAQLLLGFFFALAFFLPIYLALFVLSMQDSDLLIFGYVGVAAIVWFLMGYAIYRARDFRLSRGRIRRWRLRERPRAREQQSGDQQNPRNRPQQRAILDPIFHVFRPSRRHFRAGYPVIGGRSKA